MRHCWASRTGGPLFVALGLLAGGAPGGASPALARQGGLPVSRLELWRGTAGWVPLWRSDSALRRYGGAPVLGPPVGPAPRAAGAAAFPTEAGVQVERVRLRGSGEAWRTDLYIVRVDPARVRLTLDTAFKGPSRAWTLARAPRDALLAVNAGQFVADLPWGWVMLDGRQFLPPGAGPLVTTMQIDSAGRVSLLHGGRVPPRGRARWAFQSYPTLLRAGEVPRELTGVGGGVDVAHRDARLAIGTMADGSVLILMTRFSALGERFGALPFGLTTPEMAALMGLCGAQDAVLLDGGVSAQLLVREGAGREIRLPGLRSVPLALIGQPVGGKTP